MGRPKRESVVKTVDGPIETPRPTEIHLNGMDRQALPGMKPGDATDKLVSGIHFLGCVFSAFGVEVLNDGTGTLIPWHRIRMVRSDAPLTYGPPSSS